MHHQRPYTALEDLCPDDSLVATVAKWHDNSTKGNGFSLNPCSYAVAIHINGHIKLTAWGAGYSRDAIPQQVFAIRTLINVLPPGRKLEVHAHAELERYIALDGIGRHAMDNRGRTRSNKPLGCYPAIADIINAYDSRRWSLIPYRDMEEAPGYQEALAVAKGKARAAALKHKADHAPTSVEYPKPIILQEFVDAYPG